jgi:hypothetical protein
MDDTPIGKSRIKIRPHFWFGPDWIQQSVSNLVKRINRFHSLVVSGLKTIRPKFCNPLKRLLFLTLS